MSRSWRAIAQELIFQYLFLQDGLDWDALADGLELSFKSDNFYRGRGAGWYVRRLEICTHSWSPVLASAAARVIRCCPNLCVLTIGALEGPGSAVSELEGPGLPLAVMNAIFDTCPRTLKGLEWTADLGVPTTHKMFTQLLKMKRLQSFFMCVQAPFHVPLTYSELCGIRGVVLPDLHTLEIASPDNNLSRVLGVMAHWCLLSLRQVTLCGQRHLQNGNSFFAAHGPQLKILEFDRMEDNAHQVLTLCCRLTELVTHIRFAHDQILSGHPTVERLGLRGLHMVQHSYASRCNVIQALKAIFPSLIDGKSFPSIQVLRLLDYEQSNFTEQKWRASDVVFWASWAKRLDRKGVRLEDHEGKVFAVNFSLAKVMLPEEIAIQNDIQANIL